MFITPSSKVVARGVLRTSPTRSLSATTSYAARPRPRPAPRKPRALPPSPNAPLKIHLPSLALLKEAKKHGAVDIEPERALHILQDYAEIYNQRTPGTWEKQFCIGKNITPKTLILLGIIVSIGAEESSKIMGKEILLAASAMGEPLATLLLIRNAHDAKRLDRPEFTAPLAHLRKLAAPPHPIVQAMVLLGEVYQSQGDKETALQLFRQAASTTKSSTVSALEESKSPWPIASQGVASALVHMGRILEEQGNKADAMEAFRKAAFEHDHPAGYFHLGWKEGGHPNKTYLTKAAASGHIMAAFLLGQQHREAAINAPAGSAAKAEETRMAEEWYHVAAVSGEPYGMLGLTALLSGEGKWESALSWAKIGEKCSNEDVARKMKEMREKIEDTLDDMEQIGKG